MNETQRYKAKFRASKAWKSFKHLISVKQKGLDCITYSKLRKYSALHHADLNPDHYADLSNEDNFFYLNHETHNLVHYLYTYYKKDKDVLSRLKDVLDKMLEVNGVGVNDV